MLLQFSKFKKSVPKSVFGELQLKQISLNFKNSCSNLKISGLETKACVVFLLFLFLFILKSSYDVLKSKRPCVSLNKNTNFNQNEMGWKNGESHTHF